MKKDLTLKQLDKAKKIGRKRPEGILEPIFDIDADSYMLWTGKLYTPRLSKEKKRAKKD